MNKFLIPDVSFKSIDEISAEFFTEKGIKAVFLDIDNTLVTPHTKEPDERAKAFIDKLLAAGLHVCLISNNNKKRVSEFNTMGLYMSHHSAKPLTFAYEKVMRKLKVKRSEAAAVGDQIFSDILGANIAGLLTVYVSPIEIGGEGAFVYLKRKWEKNVLKKLNL